MAEITRETSLQELAAIISQFLEAEGLIATLSGGAAVSIYTANRYQSSDLDFVSSVDSRKLGEVVARLGYQATESKRLFSHPETSKHHLGPSA